MQGTCIGTCIERTQSVPEGVRLIQFWLNNIMYTQAKWCFSYLVGTSCLENSCKRKPIQFSSPPKEPVSDVQCDCQSTGTAKCPAGAGGPRPSQWDSFTADKLQNLTGRNMTDYLLKTYGKFIRKRYACLSCTFILLQQYLSCSWFWKWLCQLFLAILYIVRSHFYFSGNLKILVQSVLFLFMFKGTLPPTSAFLLMLLFSSFMLFRTLPPF